VQIEVRDPLLGSASAAEWSFQHAAARYTAARFEVVCCAAERGWRAQRGAGGEVRYESVGCRWDSGESLERKISEGVPIAGGARGGHTTWLATRRNVAALGINLGGGPEAAGAGKRPRRIGVRRENDAVACGRTDGRSAVVSESTVHAAANNGVAAAR
jgi:hypothetical protein